MTLAQTMMDKHTSSEIINRLVDRTLVIYSEFGTLEDNPLVKGFRDLRIETVFAGTTEIMKTIIAQSMEL